MNIFVALIILALTAGWLAAFAGTRPMRALARRLGADLSLGGREVHAVLALSPPTLFSLWRENVDGLFDVAAAASTAWPIVPVV